MKINNHHISSANPGRSRLWVLATAVSAAVGCGFIVLGCCCGESHGAAQGAANASPAVAGSVGGMGASVDEINSALDQITKEGKFAVTLDTHNQGDHGLICLTDRAGKLTLRILNNDPKADHDYVGTIGVVFKNKTRQTVPYYRDYAEIPGSPASEERAVPAAALLAAAAAPAAGVAPVYCGSSACGAGMQQVGTVGWNVVYGKPGGQAVCITNHHVLSNANAPALNHEVLLDGRNVAKLYRYHPLQFQTAPASPINYWDIALASYNQNGYAGAGFLPCTGTNTRYTFPYLMLPANSIHPYQSFHFMGFGTGCVNSFIFQGKGKGTVQIFGKNVYFDQQLLFPLGAAPGDSGSIIIRDDQYVVGLHFYLVKSKQMDTPYSMANPLYRVPWVAGGIAQPAGAPAELPVFSSTAASPDCISGAPLPE